MAHVVTCRAPFRLVFLVICIASSGFAAELCPGSGLSFTYTSADLPVTLSVLEGSPSSAPGEECSTVTFTDLALAQPAFAAGLVDAQGMLSDVLTVGNNASSQLLLCQISEPFTGGNAANDCSYSTITLIPCVSPTCGPAGEFGSIVINVEGPVSALRITGFSFANVPPGQVSDIVFIDAVPEPGSLWLSATLGVTIVVRRLRKKAQRAVDRRQRTHTRYESVEG